MGQSTRRTARMLVPWLTLLVFGCGGGSSPATPENPQEGIALAEVGETYRVYSLQKSRPPEKFADFDKLKVVNPTGIAALKRGEIVVQWGAKLPDTSEEPGKLSSPDVLAYQKQVPEQGGYVLLLDRSIKKMTADEFKTAKKAGKD